MENDRSELRWGVEQRLEFIEFRLFWEGHVNRSDLMEQFGLSVNQASTDLNRYIGFAPDNMVYDKSARTYVRGSDFKAQFLEPDASRYLAQLRSLADGILDHGLRLLHQLAGDRGQHDGLARARGRDAERVAVLRERSEAALHEDFLAGTKPHRTPLTAPRPDGRVPPARWAAAPPPVAARAAMAAGSRGRPCPGPAHSRDGLA